MADKLVDGDPERDLRPTARMESARSRVLGFGDVGL